MRDKNTGFQLFPRPFGDNPSRTLAWNLGRERHLHIGPWQLFRGSRFYAEFRNDDSRPAENHVEKTWPVLSVNLTLIRKRQRKYSRRRICMSSHTTRFHSGFRSRAAGWYVGNTMMRSR
jgi:hypothetical protein